MSQGTLLSDSEASSPTWPRWGITRRGDAFELPTPVLPTVESDSLSLLSTPIAGDGTGGRTTKGKGRPNESGLRGEVSSILPTPSANDHTGAEGPTRAARRETGETGGPALRDLTHLLPTPTAEDGERGIGADAARKGPSLRGAVLSATDPTLLPTPTARDGKGSGQNPDAARAKSRLTGLEHRDEPLNETGIDTMGRPNEGRPSKLLPTPTSQDAKQNALNEREAARNPHTMWATMSRVSSGASTHPPSSGGPRSSDGQHPDQLTIADVSSPGSSSG